MKKQNIFILLIIGLITIQSCQTVKEYNKEIDENTNENNTIIIESKEYIEAQKIVKMYLPVFLVIDKSSNEYKQNEATINALRVKETMIYDYDENQIYVVYTKILMNTVILLEESESIINDIMIGDSLRWQVTTSYYNNPNGKSVIGIYVKPKEIEIATTMTINTNKRIYNIILQSKKDGQYNAMIKFNYPIDYNSKKIEITQVYNQLDKIQKDNNVKINYNYVAKYKNNNLKWIPILIYDDGNKIYIVFSDEIKNYSMPALYGGDMSIINYRVVDNIIIIDNLYEKLILKLEKDEIIIEKKI